MQSIHQGLTCPIVRAPWADCAQAVLARAAAAERGRRVGFSAAGAGQAAALGHDRHAGDLTGELVASVLALLGSLATKLHANQGSR